MSDTKKSVKTGPRDVFTYLLTIIGLYVGVISFGALLFQYVNLAFPDPLLDNSGYFARQALRWPLALLVVAFPIYVWLSLFLQKDLAMHPEKRNLKIRKWLLYFTLFVATLVIAGDLVSLIFQFLSGELTVRFLLKVLAVLLIALGVFMYYGWNLRKSIPASAHPAMKAFVQGALVIISISIVAGFFIAGSPFKERLRQFDERRISDLQTIQFQIIDYWQSKEKLPAGLEDLQDNLRDVTPPRDPETGQLYEYKIRGDLSFELCASFQTSNKEMGSRKHEGNFGPLHVDPFSRGENFLHDATRTCFLRDIDPDRYPSLKTRPF